MASYDILTDIDNETTPFELRFTNSGDFLVDQTDEQNIRLALLSVKGNWKQFPLVGADINKMIHHSIRSNFKQIIGVELERIGYRMTEYANGENISDLDIKVEEII